MNDHQALNRQFGIDAVVRFEAGNGGLTRVVVRDVAEIYLHGAHVTRFGDVLWMSHKSLFQTGKAIRGGVPICFPWFGPKAGDKTAAAHGFARLLEWSVESVKQLPGGDVAITLGLESNEFTRTQWPAEFVARYTVTVGDALHLSLAVTNRGTAAVQFEEALHTYLTVGDVKRISIDGLAGTMYLDKMNRAVGTPQGDQPIRFTAETDRVYLATQSTCTVHDPVKGRDITVEKTGSDATVIWNPWIDKARAMADFGDDEWPGMVCVETCNVGEHAVKLAGGATHAVTAKISQKNTRT